MNPDNIDIHDYSKKYLDEYGRPFSFEPVLTDVRRRQVLKSLSKYPHEHILEVGCGLHPLFPHCGYFKSYTIVEPSREFIEQVAKLAEGKAGVRVIEGFMEQVYKKLLAGSQAFDFIIVNGVLHEVPQPDRLLQSVHRVCGRDTVVYISVPNVYSFHRLLAYEMGYISSIFDKSEMEARFQRHTRFDKKLLFEAVERNGFEILSHGTYFIKPFTNEQMEAMVDKKIVGRDIVAGLEAMAKYMPDLGCEMFVDVKVEPSTSRKR